MSLFKPEHMSVEEIIEKLQEAVDLGDSPHRGPFGTHVRKEYLVEAIDKLRTHPNTQPNEPLTLSEALNKSVERLEAYKDTGLEPKAIEQLKQIAQIFNCDPSDQSQLKALCDKFQIWKDGWLVVLPCKVGDTIYVIPSSVNYALNLVNRKEENNRVYKQVVSTIHFCGDDCLILTCDGIYSVLGAHLGKNWFFSTEEAEAKLSGLWEKYKHLSYQEAEEAGGKQNGTA